MHGSCLIISYIEQEVVVCSGRRYSIQAIINTSCEFA